ncbi:hypothetical protein H0H81_011850 [Sphagnurus paluster]|uniref:Tyrosine specific protein phosphatases domain-containing protein n=1 Tax=Sphagnurus paluster TaxID=117069 RepID=A0A9P7KKX6_9AGAR|nr:hypothetical protein H0H81_011850 [Sphagnurus paluster]
MNHLRTRSKVTEALQAAITGSLSAVSQRHRKEPMHPPGLPARSSSAAILPSEKLSTLQHSNTSSISLSLSLTLANTDLPSTHDIPGGMPRSESSPSDLNTKSSIEERKISQMTHTSYPMPIGNLFLSSCPGKKVRLQGPVKGRSGVCRDLDTDLKRMKELGVGCIICCLDDGELEFLGAPWCEYETLARDNSIDVLRIPTPEGLAPLSPAALDAELTMIINTYTLRGIPVLVHCRGGVGRAGVIACSWLIRLGLCGWVEAETTPISGASKEMSIPLNGVQTAHHLTGDYNENMATPSSLRKDTIQFVEKIITVVRRRRSLKAIETYEQVQFLVDYVDYLRERQLSGGN